MNNLFYDLPFDIIKNIYLFDIENYKEKININLIVNYIFFIKVCLCYFNGAWEGFIESRDDVDENLINKYDEHKYEESKNEFLDSCIIEFFEKDYKTIKKLYSFNKKEIDNDHFSQTELDNFDDSEYSDKLDQKFDDFVSFFLVDDFNSFCEEEEDEEERY